MKQIHHFSNAVNLTLTEGQAVLLMYRETNREVGYVGYSQYNNMMATVNFVIEQYNYGNAESFELALEKTITYVQNQGLTLLEEDPVITLAKQWACDRVLLGNEGYEWEYDYLINQLNDDDSEFESTDFIDNTLVGLTGADACRALKKEFAHLREFAFAVLSINKTYSMMIDYDGKNITWIFKGTYQEAQREMVKNLNNILPNDHQITPENLEAFLNNENKFGDDLVVFASMEEK